MIKKTFIVAAALLTLTLSGCGLKGDLYMPGQEPHDEMPSTAVF